MCSPKYNGSNRVQTLEYKWNRNYKQQSLDKQRSIESWIMRTLIHPCRHGNKNSNGSLLDLEQLGIEQHKSAWKIVVHIIVLNYDGNVEDAALLAAFAALKDTVLPPTKIIRDDAGNEVVALNNTSQQGQGIDNENNGDRKGKRLVFNFIPVPLTVGFVLMPKSEKEMETENNDDEYKILVDPTGQEEDVLDGIMSIVVGVATPHEIGNGNNVNILSVNKPGGKVIVKAQDVAACMQLCQGRAQELEPILAKIGNST